MTHPQQLPETPAGYTKRMRCHLNFGEKGGVAIHDVFDPAGELTPISYQSDTRKHGLSGFFLPLQIRKASPNTIPKPETEGVMTWSELREAWPEWLATQGEAA